MIDIEPENIGQLEYFVCGELESAVGAPFQCCVHVSPNSLVSIVTTIVEESEFDKEKLQLTPKVNPHTTGLQKPMYITQEVNHVIGHVDKKQRDDGVKLTVFWEHLQEVTRDEFDSLVWPVVW